MVAPITANPPLDPVTQRSGSPGRPTDFRQWVGLK